MADTAKFFFYEIKPLLNKKPIEIKEILKQKDFVKEANKVILELKEQKVVYDFYLKELEESFYFGKIMRTKAPDRFFVKKGHNVLDKLTKWLKSGKKQGIGETDKDVSYFILKVQKNHIIALMETGYMIAGIGKLKELLTKILRKEIDDISCKALEIEKVKHTFRFLRDKKIKSIKLKFRKNPDVPKNSAIENTLKDLHSAISDNFYIEINITAGKLSKKTKENMPIFGDVFSRFFGRNIDLNNIDIDFPEFLSNFEVEYIAQDGEIIGSENILDKYERVQINVSILDIHNDDQISRILLDKFKEKLTTNSS